MKHIAIILSGGVGSRMGLDIPKQYMEVAGKPVIGYCLETFVNDQMTDVIVIGVAEEWKQFVIEQVKKLSPRQQIYYSKPGETRQYSIFNALLVCEENGFLSDDIVVIHDAARPLVSTNLIHRCYEVCADADGVLPVIPVKDTVYYSEDGKSIMSLMNRNHLWAGQAPEAFRLGKYLKAHKEMRKEELLQINGSTELAYKSGLKCQLVEGDPMNFKITTPEDLSNFESIVRNESI